MATIAWTAQEPARRAWDELRGDHYQMDVLDERGALVCTVYGDTAVVAQRNARRIERRSPTRHD